MPLTELQTINEVMWPALHIFKAIFVYFVLYIHLLHCTLVYLIYTVDFDNDNDNYDYLGIYRVSEVPEENVGWV